MKHVNEPLPDVLAKRPEVSAVVASVVDRATTKDPRDRYGSVGEMVRDLEETLEVEAARGGGTHAARRRRCSTRSRSRAGGSPGAGTSRGLGVAMAVLGVALIVAALIFGGERLGDLGDEETPNGRQRGAAVGGRRRGVRPRPGDGRETGTQELAVDRDPTGTAWETEHYDSEDFGGIKDGVGLIVAGRRRAGQRHGSGGALRRRRLGRRDLHELGPPAPSDLDGWGAPAATIVDGETKASAVLGGEPVKSFLFWITRLPESEERARALPDADQRRPAAVLRSALLPLRS